MVVARRGPHERAPGAGARAGDAGGSGGAVAGRAHRRGGPRRGGDASGPASGARRDGVAAGLRGVWLRGGVAVSGGWTSQARTLRRARLAARAPVVGAGVVGLVLSL